MAYISHNFTSVNGFYYTLIVLTSVGTSTDNTDNATKSYGVRCSVSQKSLPDGLNALVFQKFEQQK